MAKLKKEDVLDYLESASMLEVSELITDIEEKFGVSATAPVAVAPAPASGEGSVSEEKTEFDVELSSIGDKKINVIKVIREITSLGLKEAKDLTDGAPNVIKEAVPANEANEIKAKLEEAGATVTLK
jgi:large subunit ribosomal protein L7/L12